MGILTGFNDKGYAIIDLIPVFLVNDRSFL